MTKRVPGNSFKPKPLRGSALISGLILVNKLAKWVASAALAALACSCTDDVVDVTYATRAEAVAATAIERGWIPSWIPAEAFALSEVHDVDTNESALAFGLPAKSSWRPAASSCRTADAGEFYGPGFNRNWIPETLSDYDFYSCPERAATREVPLLSALDVRRDGQHVLYWRYAAP